MEQFERIRKDRDREGLSIRGLAERQLHWEFFTAGKRDVSYQRHVVMGFAVPNPKFNHDFDMAVAFYGHRIVRGEAVEPDFFAKMLRTAADES